MPSHMLWMHNPSSFYSSKNKSAGADPWWTLPHLEQDTVSDPFIRHTIFHFLCVCVFCRYKCKSAGHTATWILTFECHVQRYLNQSWCTESVCVHPFSQASSEVYPATFCLVTGPLLQRSVRTDWKERWSGANLLVECHTLPWPPPQSSVIQASS